jgi:hypothetical protein
METTAKRYEMAISNASEISQVFLDMESGKYILALLGELVQELLDEGNTSGAALVVRKAHEAAGIPFEQSSLSDDNSAAWLSLFIDALGDTLEEVLP